MKLHYQSHSPYARKVLVFAHEAGLADRIDVIHQETSPVQRNDEVFALNPLGKVPVLVCDDGTVLFESSVICEYLDDLHDGSRLIPSTPSRRFPALLHQAVAQGLADAGIAARWESERRPEALRWPPLLEGHLQKVIAACDYLEDHVPHNEQVDIGDIALATALSWIAFRRVHDFQPGRPRLSAWYQRFCARPSMIATPLFGDTIDQPLSTSTGATHVVAMV
ncbi:MULTISPECIES: glutathione S-transferase family protein [unclassified Dyella]|uniref:glutathione S-transferase family protein n=1 Tax=unclassified Dyella TaxID=2634549 RepID=UPI000C8179F6|nr:MULTISPECIES: glutathione S-transferase family protein [unclassified Dyella]MDR3447704.1 glutathione S-transferase family protein [Dyella sp.]PMQ05365.1 putative GST-like protein YibF [Dyella sp. AD56]